MIHKVTGKYYLITLWGLVFCEISPEREYGTVLDIFREPSGIIRKDVEIGAWQIGKSLM